MGGSYIQCSECGKRALSIATRCPGCGRELPPRPERRAGRTIDLGRILPLPLVVVDLLAGTMLASAALRYSATASVSCLAPDPFVADQTSPSTVSAAARRDGS
jgi:hypothetical protein